MEFADLLFLYILLPLALVLHRIMPDARRKNMVLAGFSLLLCCLDGPLGLLVLLGLTWLNFRLSRRIRPREMTVLLPALALNLGVLLVFKHVDDVLSILGIGTETGGLLLGLLGSISQLLGLNRPATILPVGLSFYVLTAISYFMDLYRGRYTPEKDFLNFLTYMVMFPKLAQGPLVRYDQVSRQLHRRKENSRRSFDGLLRFAIGLGKKVLLADSCARFIAGMAGDAAWTLVGSWLTALLFFFRVYFDISGCCDMAVGLGKLFGFRFPESFDAPYCASWLGDFCARWNMTLVAFFKDYVYIPLGGSRLGAARQLLNLLAVWLLIGLWHGGTLNFLVWALLFFVFQSSEKLLLPLLADLPPMLRRLLMYLLLVFAWVFFAYPDINELSMVLKGMLGFGGLSVPGLGKTVLASIPLSMACWIGISPLPQTLGLIFKNACGQGGKKQDRLTPGGVLYLAGCFGSICLLLWLCTACLAGGGTVVTIYGVL